MITIKITVFKILTIDGIEIQRSQTAATPKRPTSDGSNAIRYGNRSQTAATAKRTISDGSNTVRYGNRGFCTRALYQSVLNVIVQHSVYR